MVTGPKQETKTITTFLGAVLRSFIQTLTHFRNALRGEVLRWYNALPLLDVENLNWVNDKTQFEQDSRAAPSISSVIQKLPEIRQKTMNQLFSMSADVQKYSGNSKQNRCCGSEHAVAIKLRRNCSI